MTDTDLLSDSVEEYMQAIHRMSQVPGGVSTSGLARRLGVRPASVTGMLRKLADMGWITYRRYHDIALTPAGDELANELLRRHRLTERLLTDVLDVPLEDAHGEACRLEHAVSPQLESRIAQKLGRPDVCPHGHPLDVDADDATVSLAEAPAKRQLTVVRLEEESAEVVRYLAERNLLPGVGVEIDSREPLGDAVVLDVEGEPLTVSAELAATIRVTPSGKGR
jgi:DtxR family Mn-dependent transcriptional regulator